MRKVIAMLVLSAYLAAGSTGASAGSVDTEPLCPKSDVPKEWRTPDYPAAFEQRWPGGWKQFDQRVSEYIALYTAVLSGSLERYVRFNGRVPSSLRDLCESGATALRCEDWINPFTGAPFAEGREGVPGAVFLETGPSSSDKPAVTLSGTFVNPVTGEIYTSRHEWEEYSSSLRAGKPLQVSRGQRAAISVADTLENLMDIACVRQEKSWARIVRRLPFLNKLRNDFTGGYARLVQEFSLPAGLTGKQISEETERLLSSVARSPGDFVIVWLPHPALFPLIVVMGENGTEERR